jgi:hypothetical protein
MNPNKTNIRKWVEALRSGHYKQSKRVLTKLTTDKKIKGHCCMGVACRVAIAEGIKLKQSRSLGYITYDGALGAMPDKVVNWLGVDSDDPKVLDNTLSFWNDLEGKTFKEIADLIEKEYLK